MGCPQWIPAPQDELEKLPPARGKLKLYPSVHLRGEISRRSFLPGKQEVNKLAGVDDRRFCRRPSWRGLQPAAPPERMFSERLSFCGAGIYCRRPGDFRRHARALEYPPSPHFPANSSLPLRRGDAGVFPSQPPYFVSPHPKMAKAATAPASQSARWRETRDHALSRQLRAIPSKPRAEG